MKERIVIVILMAILAVSVGIPQRYLPGESYDLEKSPENVANYTGESITLTCSSNNIGDYRVTWVELVTAKVLTLISVGTEIVFDHIYSKRYKITHDNPSQYDLTIANIGSHDAGTYQCQSFNLFTLELNRQQAELIVIESTPNCSSTVENGFVRESTYYTMECTVNYAGSIAPNMTWSGPGPFNVIYFIAATVVRSIISFVVDLSFHNLTYQCLTNFTINRDSANGVANNAPVFSHTHTFLPFQVYSSGRTLYITAWTTLYDLYIDGVQTNLARQNNYDMCFGIELPSHSRLISVMAIDSTRSCAGILASVTDDFHLSDVTWRCTDCVSPEWYELGYNDSDWEDAYEIGQNGNVSYPDQCNSLPEISSISLNAYWIWASNILDTPAYSQVVYCRAYLPTCERESPCQNGGSCNTNSPIMCTCIVGYTGEYCETVEEVLVTLTAQEKVVSVYIDNVQKNIRNGHDAAKTDDVTVSYFSRLIAVSAMQQSTDCPGILVSVTDGTGDILLTGTNWKCSPDATVKWFELDFDDSKWDNATLVQRNIASIETDCPDLPIVLTISQNAYWIWAEMDDEYSINSYCRGYIQSATTSNVNSSFNGPR